HDHDHDHEPRSHELLRAPDRPPPARVSAGKYVTINYTLRTNGAIRHISTAAVGCCPPSNELLRVKQRVIALPRPCRPKRLTVSATRHCSSGWTPSSLAGRTRSKPGCVFSRKARTVVAWRT